MRLVPLLLVTCGLLPGRVDAQEPPDRGECTWAACALRMQGGAILAGEEGVRITSFGFLDAPTLTPWMEVSDSAAHYARIVEANYVRGQVLTLSGSVVFLAGVTMLALDEGDGDVDLSWAGIGTAVVGALLAHRGRTHLRRSSRAAESAIWWYNRSLAEDPGVRVPETRVRMELQTIPEDRRNEGTFLGILGGAAVGLSTSARHDEFATGLGETLAFTGLGALLGRQIGKQIRR